MKFLLQSPAEKVTDRRKASTFGDGLRRTNFPGTLRDGRGGIGHVLFHHKQSYFRMLRRFDFIRTVPRPAQTQFHVGLPAAKPYVTHQNFV